MINKKNKFDNNQKSTILSMKDFNIKPAFIKNKNRFYKNKILKLLVLIFNMLMR